MGRTFYISDLHFGHENIISFDNRPFNSIEDHDNEIIRRWNETVGIDDDVWILGDISWYKPMKTIEIYKQLNGTKHLVIGNHDRKLLKNRDVQTLFSEIVDYKEILFDETSSVKGVILSHYPMLTFNHHYYDGYIHLYAHVHNSWENDFVKECGELMQNKYEVPCKMINVGCMLPYMDYTPRTLDELLEQVGRE